MKNVRNLPIFLWAFLSIAVFGVVGCNKEQPAQTPVFPANTIEPRADHCGGKIRPVQTTFLNNMCYPSNCLPERTGANNTGGFLLWKKRADGTINFDRGQQASTDLAAAMGGVTSGKAAHHIVAWNLKDHELVQRAGLVGFHPNDGINGVALQISFGAGRFTFHAYAPKYDAYVRAIMDRYKVDSRYQTPDVLTSSSLVV